MQSPDLERWDRVRATLAKNNLAALVCRLTENVVLLSGYWPILGRSVVVFPADGQPVLISPISEAEAVEQGWIRDVRTFRAWRIGDADPEASIAKLLGQVFAECGLTGKRVGFVSSFGDIAATQRFFEPWAGIHTALASWRAATGNG
jgi:Xaa-Pro aminopeptidase